jgi:hypothetical protein
MHGTGPCCWSAKSNGKPHAMLNPHSSCLASVKPMMRGALAAWLRAQLVTREHRRLGSVAPLVLQAGL